MLQTGGEPPSQRAHRTDDKRHIWRGCTPFPPKQYMSFAPRGWFVCSSSSGFVRIGGIPWIGPHGPAHSGQPTLAIHHRGPVGEWACLDRGWAGLRGNIKQQDGMGATAL